MAEVTIEEIRALDAVILDRKDTTLIANLLPARETIISRPVGIGSILASMAPNGGTFLNSLEAMATQDANVRWVFEMIKQGTLDIGMEVTRGQIQAFAEANPAMASAIASLLDLAVQRTPVSEHTVRKLCWSDNGVWQV